jgi:hypothetical protein
VGGQEIRAKYVSGSGSQVLRFEFITGSSLDEAADLAGAVYALQGGAVSTAAGRALPLPSSAGTDDPIRLTLALADNSGLRGSDPTRLQFRAEVAAGWDAGHQDANGIRIEANSLRLTGSTKIHDASGNPADLSHTVVQDNPDYRVDTLAPTVSLTPDTLNNQTQALVVSAEPGRVYLVHQSVTVTDLASILNAPDNLWNSFAVPAGSAGASVPVPTQGLAGGDYRAFAVDTAGNLSAGSAQKVTVDGVLPLVQEVRLASAQGAQDGWLNVGDVVTAQVVFSEPVFVQGGPQLGLQIGQAVVQSSYSAGSGTNTRRSSRPSCVRIGMFWRFGSCDDRRPVAATVWLSRVCTRPVDGATSRGSASTYVDLSLSTSRYSRIACGSG